MDSGRFQPDKRAKMPTPRQVGTLLAMLVATAILAVWVTGHVLAEGKDPYRGFRRHLILFKEAYEAVERKYVEEVDMEQLTYAGIEGMLATLDPYSQFLEKRAYDELMIETKGKFEGLGITIGITDGVLTVISPIEGTPAYNVGIQAGDRIVKIEGKSTKGYSTAKAASLLRGPKGTKVTITIEREGEEEPIDYTITRGEIKVKSITYAGMVEDGIGYLRLARFSERTGEEMEGAINGLKKQGVKSLILDLRLNSGGLLQQAVAVADKFLNKGNMVVYTMGRSGDQNSEYKAQKTPIYGEGPLVVLVDRGSASASEIVAGAIQDWDRGLIVGEPTFGKGLVQTVLSVGRSGYLKLTTAKYYTPSGRCIQREEDHEQAKEKQFRTKSGRIVYGGGGIAPDIGVKPEERPRLVTELARNSMFFKFAIHYTATHRSLPRDFEVDEGMIAEFKRFLKECDFDYRAAGEGEIERLRQTAEREGYSQALSQLLDRLEGQIELEKERDFERSLSYIKRGIRSQIAAKLWGNEARMEALLRDDPQLAAAIDILKDLESYYAKLGKG